MTPMHLLVLEHDPLRREALLGTLRSAGHHAVAAPDGPAAAAAIGLPGFDALLLDLALPDLELARLREVLAPTEPAAPDSLEAAERRHIALALRHTGGNKRQAAHLLGISRSTLLHKVRKYGLAPAVLLALAVTALVGPRPTAAQSAAAIARSTVKAASLSFDGHATAGDYVGTTTSVTGDMTGGDSLAAVRTQEVSLVGYVRREGEGLRVRTDFPLDLTSYKIGGLSKMLGMLKMDEHIEVHVDVTFAPSL